MEKPHPYRPGRQDLKVSSENRFRWLAWFENTWLVRPVR